MKSSFWFEQEWAASAAWGYGAELWYECDPCWAYEALQFATADSQNVIVFFFFLYHEATKCEN